MVRSGSRGEAPPAVSALRAASAALQAPPAGFSRRPSAVPGSPSLRSTGCRRHGVPVPAGQLGSAGSGGAGGAAGLAARPGPAPHGAAASALQFATRVVSCREAELRPESGGEPMRGFQVVLEDTILFPEGGGQVGPGPGEERGGTTGPGHGSLSPQPDDRGLIGAVPVLRVTRRGAEAVHFVETALEPGSAVLLSLDWERRFDHMQQHSGAGLGRVMRAARASSPSRSSAGSSPPPSPPRLSPSCS